MSCVNFVDHRTNKYNINIDAVFEPSCHDNSIKGATQFKNTKEFQCDDLVNTTVIDAFWYAIQWDCPVTVYLYDAGSGPLDPTKTKKKGKGNG